MNLSHRPETYRTMGVNGPPVSHLSDLSKVPGRILDRKLVKTFRLDICLVEEQFEMVRYVEKGCNPRWGYFPREGHPEEVTRFDGTKITPVFLQAIAYEVYVKNVTFGLLHQWLGDMGMTVSENTLRNWLKKGKKYLDRMVVELKRMALEKDAVGNCDETWCKVRKYDHYKKCYMWVMVNKAERVVIFFYEDGSRGRDVLTNFLGDAELKALMSDGYNVYVFIGDELKTDRYKDTDHQVRLAHVRAKFVKARMEGGDKRADVFLENINLLFRFEREYDREMLTDVERTRRRRGADHGGYDKSAGKPFAGVEKRGGAEKLLYAGGPELSSQVLEGSLHLYKGRALFDLEQSGGTGGASPLPPNERTPCTSAATRVQRLLPYIIA